MKNAEKESPEGSGGRAGQTELKKNWHKGQDRFNADLFFKVKMFHVKHFSSFVGRGAAKLWRAGAENAAKSISVAVFWVNLRA